MSVRLMGNVLDYVHGLPHGSKLVLLCMADHADQNDLAWPSFDKLAKRCDMSRRHVQPLALGGPDEIENLVPACRSCNCSKGARV